MIYIALIILIATLVIGVPVPVSFMASCAWLIFFGGVDQVGYQATQLLPYGFNQMNSVSLIAIAMFILAGGIMERGKIAEKLNKPETEVYREEISHGTAYFKLELDESAVNDFIRTWGARGVGWIAVLDGSAVDLHGNTVPGRFVYRAYYGSSEYDSKQMADLLDRVIQDARALDIETMTPREIAVLKSMWKGV